MANAAISFGSKLGLLNNAAIGEVYYDEFRPFLRGIDALVQISLIGGSTTPPVSPSDGDAYLIVSGTGIWTGKDNQIAVWATQNTDAGNDTLNPAWDYYVPKAGWIAWLPNLGFVYFDGTGWINGFSQTNQLIINTPFLNQEILQPNGTQFSVIGLTAGTGSGGLTVFQDSITLTGRFNVPAASTSLDSSTNPNRIGIDDTTNLGSQYTIDATTANVVITLPNVVGVSNGAAPTYSFTRNDSTPGSGHTVTILPTTPDKISGNANVTLLNFQSVTLTQPAASNLGGFVGGWVIIAKV